MNSFRMVFVVSLLFTCFILAGSSFIHADMLVGEKPSRPKSRLGCLPYGGLSTFMKKVDPSKLAPHRYGGNQPRTKSRSIGRGAFYTCNGGFFDVAHYRMSVDWTAYYAHKVEAALHVKESEIKLGTIDPTKLYLNFRYPEHWDEIDPEDRAQEIRTFSIQMGQFLAFWATAWHEVATWYGFSVVPFVSEKKSAFSYEDIPSHILGIKIAGLALEDPNLPFDEAVEHYFEETMKVLKPVSIDDHKKAIAAVKGKWWKGGLSLKPIKRFIDLGLDDGEVTPWVVEGLEACGEEKPAPYSFSVNYVPHEAFGIPADEFALVSLDFSGFLFQRKTFRILLEIEKRNRADPFTEMTTLMKNIEIDIEEKLGEGACHVDSE